MEKLDIRAQFIRQFPPLPTPASDARNHHPAATRHQAFPDFHPPRNRPFMARPEIRAGTQQHNTGRPHDPELSRGEKLRPPARHSQLLHRRQIILHPVLKRPHGNLHRMRQIFHQFPTTRPEPPGDSRGLKYLCRKTWLPCQRRLPSTHKQGRDAFYFGILREIHHRQPLNRLPKITLRRLT